jgi:broad specificity phosphatase PhoE
VSHLFLVRHAQASFLEEDYDKLSPLGEEQARRLGEYWARQNFQFDRVCAGPRVRQRHTADIVAGAFEEAGRTFPKITSIAEFDEYDGENVLKRALPKLLETNEQVRELCEAFTLASDSHHRSKSFQRLFAWVITRWVGGELVVPGVESWGEFGARVNRRISQVISECGHGVTAAVFCSGGPIAIAVQRALNLSPQRTLQVMWMSRNASYSDFLFSGDRFTLSGFNASPHLDHPSLLTYR